MKLNKRCGVHFCSGWYGIGRFVILLTLVGLLCSCAEKSRDAIIHEFVQGDWLMTFGVGVPHSVRIDENAVVERTSSVVLLRITWKSGDNLEYTILTTTPNRTFQAKVVAKQDGSAMWFNNPSTGATLIYFKRVK